MYSLTMAQSTNLLASVATDEAWAWAATTTGDLDSANKNLTHVTHKTIGQEGRRLLAEDMAAVKKEYNTDAEFVTLVRKVTQDLKAPVECVAMQCRLLNAAQSGRRKVRAEA